MLVMLAKLVELVNLVELVMLAEVVKSNWGFVSLDKCLAQIRFVINAPKQVTKPKGYVAALSTLILVLLFSSTQESSSKPFGLKSA